jgi:nitroimidazol reductase NimA-like FMN-containing flavoprotein (pyridoxamine 5'-phosphate oxidase superfamily)
MLGFVVGSPMAIDELHSAGVTRMDDAEIRAFVSNQGMGVLGLPSDGAPYVVPMSFGFDGEDCLYFTYALGSDSRKKDLSDRAEAASVLVYDATSPFIWQSTLTADEATVETEETAGDVATDALAREGHSGNSAEAHPL